MSISEILVKSGLVDSDMCNQLRRWGFHVPDQDLGERETFKDADAIEAAIQEAVESEDLVQVRETDLDVFKQYLKTRKSGILHLVTDQQEGDLTVTYGISRAKDLYIIPWHSENVEDLMTNGRTYLVDGRKKIYFASIRELFYDDVKAFMICVPISKEVHAPSKEE